MQGLTVLAFASSSHAGIDSLAFGEVIACRERRIVNLARTPRAGRFSASQFMQKARKFFVCNTLVSFNLSRQLKFFFCPVFIFSCFN